MVHYLKLLWNLIKETFIQWFTDKAPKHAAALSFYTVFATAPLLIFITAIAGLVLDKAAAQGRIVAQIQDLVGGESAQMLEQIIRNASKPEHGIIATIVGFVTLLVGATGVFVELKDSLNTIWNVEPSKIPSGIKAVLKERVLSVAMIMGVGFILLVSLVVSATLAAVSEYFGNFFPEITFLMKFANFFVSMGVITVLFAMMFKFLPDYKITWGDVWIGAALTAGLFTLGKSLIGLYIGKGAIASVYGAAGSLAVLFIWVYYSAQIFFLGAEFTQVYARKHGSKKGDKKYIAKKHAAANAATKNT